jgi:uncharacterized membrane protein YgcG
MMKCLYAFAILLMSSRAFAQENTALSWSATRVKIDGDAHDWSLPLHHYDTNTKLFFDFKNDSNNLYLCFQSNDEIIQVKIIRAGMKINLSNKINGKHKASINFPLPAEESKPERTENAIAADPSYSHQKLHTAFLAGDSLMIVKGFTNREGAISTNDTSGIHAAINWDENNMLTYEVSVPLKELCGNDFNAKDLSKGISLNVIIDALKMPAQSRSKREENGSSGEGEGESRGGRMGGSGRSGGMGHGGGRMGGQGNSEMQSDRSAMFQQSELKEKLSLAMHS